ncbi:putative methyltransferase [Helianthus annuus]|uniref:Methyltransferase n=1 Tax=Helianthus annuus TaxID=4232 RepID=A0A251T9X7_HELAN|nr:benzoate carboxyl methyltransferase [Helianthus annuus]KAF5811014.1 putative methyltransferase [Helianthus annuus]KAJ0581742.1 putative methyltransferase [Helianthus annuus]KAJ0597706.1 putative methyltransferase [Helianthus annuus]KAJ0927723.1 putative methyltransferase [Helianthus annuus]KAJ0932147.1 putative methyltransferase [Helianthus annuus]
MALVNILHMTIGHEDSSYAKNSLLQETVIQKAIPFLNHSIKGIASRDIFIDGCFKIADLGCGSSRNTLLVASNIIDIVIEVCKENNHKPPQFQVCLNDLFGNDFNYLFKLLPEFYANLKREKGENVGPCIVSAVPGSFYGRLFPDKSLHLVHSSFSVHWLSQVPEGIENNTLNIYPAKTSPSNVFQAYAKQFRIDFTNFLKLRSKEIVRGGCMILTFLGRSFADPTSDDNCSLWEQLAQSLQDMIKEGLVRESDLNSFNLPLYYPCVDEVRDAIKNEGSFSLDNLTVFQVNWDPQDTDYTNTNDSIELGHKHGRNTAKHVRAVTEPLLTSHFGNSINIDALFKKFKKHLAEHLANKKTRHLNIVISLTKNE